jgi:hypothetical protein
VSLDEVAPSLPASNDGADLTTQPLLERMRRRDSLHPIAKATVYQGIKQEAIARMHTNSSRPNPKSKPKSVRFLTA